MSGPGFAGCCQGHKISNENKGIHGDMTFTEDYGEALAFLNSIFGGDLPVMLGVEKRKKEKAVKVEYDENVRFSYFGDTGNCNNHGGILTMCSVINDVQEVVFYGMAFCSPNDVYNKEKGKAIAYRDMELYTSCIGMVKKTHNDINTRIFADMVAHDDGPSWAKGIIMDILFVYLDGFND